MRTELTIIDLINWKHAFVAIEIQNKIELNRQLNQNLEAVIADVMDYKFLSNAETLPKRFIGDIASIKAGGDCPQEWSKYKTKIAKYQYIQMAPTMKVYMVIQKNLQSLNVELLLLQEGLSDIAQCETVAMFQ